MNIHRLTKNGFQVARPIRTAKQAEELISTITKVMKIPGDFIEESESEAKFKEIISRRMKHCDMELESHVSQAKKTPMGLIAFWEDGHFSLPVYEALEQALNQNPSEWNPLIWEQILRQMFEEQNRDRYLFYYATEMLLCQREQ